MPRQNGPDVAREIDLLPADRGSYKIVVPGDPAQSRLLARISAASKASRMPPPQAGKTLTDVQIDTVRKWIAQGAK